MNCYPHIRETYISDRLKEQLFQIKKYPITVISAPAGYGKTTALRWWNTYRKRYLPNSILYQLTALDDSFDGLWSDLCGQVQLQNPAFAGHMREIGFPADKRTLLLLLRLWEQEEAHAEELPDIFLSLDDMQFLPAQDYAPLLLLLSERMPARLHLILLSRNTVFTPSQILKLGSRLLLLPRDFLQLRTEEIQAYAALCGLPLPAGTAQKLTEYSGGWIAVLYLIFCQYTQTGTWQFRTNNIDRLLTEVMLDPLPPRMQEFLIVLSTAADFTAEEAAYLWNQPDADAILHRLTEENAFIVCDTSGIYHCHNLLCQNTERLFAAWEPARQRAVLERLGDWKAQQARQKDYVAAMMAYRQAEAWDKLLATILLDRGSSLGGIHRDMVDEWYHSCPPEILHARPEAMLLFALEFFTAGNIPQMIACRDVFLEAIGQNTRLSDEERRHFQGECEILTGFLSFNSIFSMSEHHRKACSLMTRPSSLVDHRSPWTFGSPSVLMLYHRQSGALQEENAAMQTCMPYYYQLTRQHGYGAEQVMQAESCLLQGNRQEAEILYYQAAAGSLERKQYSIFAAAEWVAVRLCLLRGDYPAAQKHLDSLYRRLLENRQFVLLPAADLCTAWTAAMLGQTDRFPEWMLDENARNTVIDPAEPIFLITQNELFLAQEKWTYVLSRLETCLQICTGKHMLLASIYLHIQAACAYSRLNRPGSARSELQQALDLAAPDALWLPFAEHTAYIRPLWENFSEKPEIRPAVRAILRLSDTVQQASAAMLSDLHGTPRDCGLSDRELEIARLAAQRKTTREIASALGLSENTVKSHLKHIYDKMGILGTARNKRHRLQHLLDTGRS